METEEAEENQVNGTENIFEEIIDKNLPNLKD